jgi:hypothetical protein
MTPPHQSTPISLKLRVKGKSPDDIAPLVIMMLDRLDLAGEYRLRVRGIVRPRPGYDSSVELKEGGGVRLAVQNAQGQCFECFLSSGKMHWKHLWMLLASKLPAGCFRASQTVESVAQPHGPSLVPQPLSNRLKLAKRLAKAHMILESRYRDVRDSERDLEKAEKAVAKAKDRLDKRQKRLDSFMARIMRPDFYVAS